MVLNFNPPDDLIRDYLRRPSPGQIASDGINQALQMYAQQKAMEQNQALKQQQNDLLSQRESREGRQQFYDYGDVGSLPQDVQASLGQPVQGPVTQEGIAPQPSSLIDRYNKFLQDNPQGLKGQQFTEDTVLQKDDKGSIVGQSTFKRPVKGKTLMSGPTGGQNYNFTKPQQSQFVDESTGVPLEYTPSTGYTPARLQSGIKPVPRKGDESSVSDANVIVQQVGNVDKLFDAYENKSGGMARLQATGVGGVIDPEMKQLEDSLKLTAFTFGGKNLTENEKQVVFGALFPSWKDNKPSRNQKRDLLKSFYAGKVDLLQAANLLGPAGAQLHQMLQSKMGQGGSQSQSQNALPQVGGTFQGGKVLSVKRIQ